MEFNSKESQNANSQRDLIICPGLHSKWLSRYLLQLFFFFCMGAGLKMSSFYEAGREGTEIESSE